MRSVLDGRYMGFQLTPPRGGDADLEAEARGEGEFQLTPPRGGDFGADCVVHPRFISTHAPARGRLLPAATFCGDRLFQLTPPRGGDSKTSQNVSKKQDNIARF